jgi:hypothetical protein
VLRPGRSSCSTARAIACAAALLRLVTLAVPLIVAHGCATQEGPAQMMEAAPQAAARREVQTRRISDVGEAELLSACVSVLQDLGFRIKASEARLGVITATKPRSIEEMLADAGRLGLLAGATFGLHPELAAGPPDGFAAVIGTRAVGGQPRVHDVRVDFYRIWRDPGSFPQERLRGAMVITSPALYQQFFERVGATLARSRAGN